MKKDKRISVAPPVDDAAKFKITKAKIREMYDSDEGLQNYVKNNNSSSVSINNLTLDTFATKYFALGALAQQRKYSNEAYTFYPIYAQLIDTLANMFQCKYIYTPHMVKQKAQNVDYGEIYSLMGEVVDGISIETTVPNLLTKLFLEGVVNFTCAKNKPSNTITTLVLPANYCRKATMTQYGTYVIQFDFQYFDDLRLTQEQLEITFDLFPDEFKALYNQYKSDTNLRWAVLDPKYSTAIQLNDNGFPTKLKALFALKRYDTYSDNELERSTQQLEKIVTHVLPTWEDKLIVDMDEMKELHQSMAKSLAAKTKHCRLFSSFGNIDVKSISEDGTHENKTLANAFDAIYNDSGENQATFSGEIAEALALSITRDESIVFKYIQQIINFYNITVNNLYNFKGYQCDIEMLPISNYNYKERLETYRQSATLGVGKLEFIVASGIKQSHIPDKFTLEDYLQLDKLKPLSTSYTQNDNAKKDNDNDSPETSNNNNNSNPQSQEVDE